MFRSLFVMVLAARIALSAISTSEVSEGHGAQKVVYHIHEDGGAESGK